MREGQGEKVGGVRERNRRGMGWVLEEGEVTWYRVGSNKNDGSMVEIAKFRFMFRSDTKKEDYGACRWWCQVHDRQRNSGRS
jgi:hypothetical protein